MWLEVSGFKDKMKNLRKEFEVEGLTSFRFDQKLLLKDCIVK